MFREILGIWKQDNFMENVVERFGEMLYDAEFVFDCAWRSIIGQMVIGEVKQQVYDKDININKNEREIRRMLAEHLSINPKKDASGCLVMMSLVKDAERIGDYSKNIFDLAIMLEKDAKKMKYMDRLSSVQRKISEHFPLLQRAFLDSNEEAANTVLKDYEQIKGECKGLLLDLFDDELPLREAVTTTILIRSFKRINSHMSNIATGMVYPMDKIDFIRARDGLLD